MIVGAMYCLKKRLENVHVMKMSYDIEGCLLNEMLCQTTTN